MTQEQANKIEKKVEFVLRCTVLGCQCVDFDSDNSGAGVRAPAGGGLFMARAKAGWP